MDANVNPLNMGLSYYPDSAKVTVRTKQEAASHIRWLLSCVDYLEKGMDSLPGEIEEEDHAS